MSIALLIVDMQQAFDEIKKCHESINDALEYINEASKLFREADKPVIVIQDEEAGEGPDSEGYKLMDQLVVKDTDYRISKVYNSAFWKTGLDELLKQLEVEFLVVSGFAAEYCVLFTYNGAMERGYNASLLQHGVADYNPGQAKETQYLRPVVSIETLTYILKKV